MMNSIIKNYDGDNSEGYSMIINRFSAHINRITEAIDNNIGQQLTDLLLLPYNPSSETLMLLAQPWIRASVLIDFLASFDLSEEKIRINHFIQLIDQMKKFLMLWPRKSLDFIVLETSCEPQIDLLSHFLDEIASLLQGFAKLNFRHGAVCSVNNLQRYAIDSLFWMGKTMELSESGKPTQLHKYIHIVTDRLYADIAQDHRKYKNSPPSYLEKYEQDESFYLQFIFNPKCSVTKDKLTIIRDLKNSRSLSDTP